MREYRDKDYLKAESIAVFGALSLNKERWSSHTVEVACFPARISHKVPSTRGSDGIFAKCSHRDAWTTLAVAYCRLLPRSS